MSWAFSSSWHLNAALKRLLQTGILSKRSLCAAFLLAGMAPHRQPNQQEYDDDKGDKNGNTTV